MLTPFRKVKDDFFGDFLYIQYSESCILAPSSEESAPRRKTPGATPGERFIVRETKAGLQYWGLRGEQCSRIIQRIWLGIEGFWYNLPAGPSRRNMLIKDA